MMMVCAISVVLICCSGLEYLIAHSPELITEPDLQNNMPLHTAILLQCETTVTFLLSQVL